MTHPGTQAAGSRSGFRVCLGQLWLKVFPHCPKVLHRSLHSQVLQQCCEDLGLLRSSGKGLEILSALQCH